MITVHAKQSRDSVWCGKSIFGEITDAEGNEDGHYGVTCEECLKRKEQARMNRNRLDTEKRLRRVQLKRQYQQKHQR